MEKPRSESGSGLPRRPEVIGPVGGEGTDTHTHTHGSTEGPAANDSGLLFSGEGERGGGNEGD